jgi:hypothetical protein
MVTQSEGKIFSDRKEGQSIAKEREYDKIGGEIKIIVDKKKHKPQSPSKPSSSQSTSYVSFATPPSYAFHPFAY